MFLAGCKTNNNLQVNVGTATLVSTGREVDAPIGPQQVFGSMTSLEPGTKTIGSVTSFSGFTSAIPNAATLTADSIAGVWPTFYASSNDEMPAYWTVGWENPPPYCISQTPPYPPLGSIYELNDVLFTPTTAGNDNPAVSLKCYTNDPTHLNFTAANISPQFSLDDAPPTALQIASILPISAAPANTTLQVLTTTLSSPATVVASSVAANGMSSTYAFPKQSNGFSLPAGAYLSLVTVNPPGGTQTVNGMEPFYIGHDDTTWPAAFGVANATPETVTVTGKQMANPNGGPALCTKTTTTTGGTPIPLVTLLTQSALAVGSPTKTVAVGLNPTVVIPFNDLGKTTSIGNPVCPSMVTTYSGAQSALVLNTGGNSVSVISIGTEYFPSGTASVGHQPVAAAINRTETFAYVANYADNTVSEVNLSNLQQTRTIAVMTHPSSLTFDTSGNLWVGGQGSVMMISIPSWAVASTSTVNGTITGMNFDPSTSLLVETTLQNGSVATPMVETTGSALVAFSNTAHVSYSSQNTFNTTTGATSASNFAGDNVSYTKSSAAPYLAFPAQSAVPTPIYTASDGDIAATVSGTAFTVFIVGTNQVIIAGTLPHPARGVAVTSNMVYFTMPESNSLVSLPIQLP
jgi:YVTN family beta-propeller protein